MSRTRLIICRVCDVQYEWERKACPHCGTPSKVYEVPELVALQIEIPVEVWRALVRLAIERDEQPNVTVVTCVERMISDAHKRNRV